MDSDRAALGKMIDTTQLTGKQRHLLTQLQGQTTIPSLMFFCEEQNFDFNFAKGFILSGILDEYLEIQELLEEKLSLTQKGLGLGGVIPGYELAIRLSAGMTEVEKLKEELGETFSINYGALRKIKAVDMRGQNSSQEIVVLSSDILDDIKARQTVFSAVIEGKEIDLTTQLDLLVKQSFVAKKVIQDYKITPNSKIHSINIKSLVTNLTSDLIISGQWKDVDLKPYNIYDQVPDIACGRSSILGQCIHRIREIFLDMGFDEMSGSIVESSFWNFDALFTAQDHPAREIQDTFYLSKPASVSLPSDLDLVQRVRRVHEENYGGTWSEMEATKGILRTHTTASTARKLSTFNCSDGKYFSIDKVFRNETVDRTHLAEFHQIEGVVIGENLNVRTLLGYLSSFYEQLGFQNLQFRSTYNPYTEPSLEVYAYHEPSKKYLEIGNSGLFRPEMLEPLGVKSKSTVAWGLGLERIAMLLHGVEKLSDLIGPGINLTNY
jgi:phenylalanyl-tRNA synthetase alpha chain